MPHHPSRGRSRERRPVVDPDGVKTFGSAAMPPGAAASSWPNLTAPPQPTSGKPDYNDANAVTERLNSMVQLLVMSPEFQSK